MGCELAPITQHQATDITLSNVQKPNLTCDIEL